MDAKIVNKEELLDKAMTKLKAERKGARVFCVRCGSTGQRTPLRRWHNSYICNECWKILKAVGEEEFRKNLEAQLEKENHKS